MTGRVSRTYRRETDMTRLRATIRAVFTIEFIDDEEHTHVSQALAAAEVPARLVDSLEVIHIERLEEEKEDGAA
jgi:hypothetical protein